MPDPAFRPTLTHNASLDALRGLAAFVVCLFHMKGCGFGPINHEWILVGQMGVNLFFCLSGFLIARSVPTPTEWHFSLYFDQRARRILPNFYIAIFLVLTLVDNKVLFSMSAGKWLADLFAHLTLLHGWFADFRVSIMGPFWTLSHEWCFYLLMGAFAPLIRNRNGWLFPVVLLLVGIGSRWGHQRGLWTLPGGYAHPLCMWDQFAMGIFAAFIAHRRPVHWKKTHLLLIGTAGVLLTGFMLHKYTSVSVDLRHLPIEEHGRAFSKAFWKRSSNALYFNALLATGFSLTLLALWLTPASRMQWLHHTPLPWMGKVSYSTYLYHVPVAICFMSSSRAIAPGSIMSHPTIAFIIVLTVVYAFSEFAYRFFEKPWFKPAKG